MKALARFFMAVAPVLLWVGLSGLRFDGRVVRAGAVVASPVGPDPLPAGVRVETFVPHVTMPITLLWGPDGRLYYSDYSHMAIFVHHSDGSPAGRIDIPGVTASEGSLLGMTFHPDFPGEPWIYIQYIQKEPLRNRIARFRYENGVASDLQLFVETELLSATCINHGGKLVFGPDEALYAAWGDHCRSHLVQDLSRPEGKVLRMDPTTGAGLPDNPFYDGEGPNEDRIWALGLRNPFGMAFDPATGELWLSDNGPACGDEINRIVRGGNYGWPLSGPECVDPGEDYIPPLWNWGNTRIVPTGTTFYQGNTLPYWYGHLFVCSWSTGRLHRLQLDGNRNQIVAETVYDLSPAGCTLDVVTGPDGNLYTNTREGAIYRLSSIPMWWPLIQQVVTQ